MFFNIRRVSCKKKYYKVILEFRHNDTDDTRLIWYFKLTVLCIFILNLKLRRKILITTMKIERLWSIDIFLLRQYIDIFI